MSQLTRVLFGPPAETLEVLLEDSEAHDFSAPERILRDLSPEQAVTVPPGLPYSVAKIVAHMHSNVKFNLGLIQAADPSTYRERFEDWPEVTTKDWPQLAGAFLADLRALTRIAREKDLDRIVIPAANDVPAWTVGYKLAASVAKHNAYHFGQIIVIRRLLGAWT
jgi:hypothetical protein